jgi:stearoyl-CoA 9-desaturase NADPH oxidoreductase
MTPTPEQNPSLHPAASLRGRPLSPWARRLLASPLLDALASPHGVSRYLELVSPLWSLDEERAVVTRVHRETADAVTLTLRPNEPSPGFRAGQFVRVQVEVEGTRRTRCYSISCSEHRDDGQIQITVKADPKGVVSRFLNDHAAPGLVVGLSPADGDFTLPAARPDRLLLVSGGSGITPVMSMLRTLCDEGHDRPVTFLHYARSRGDLIFGDELEALAAVHPNVTLVTVFTRSAPGPHSRGLAGHFDRTHLGVAAAGHAQAEVYVCGPEGLIDAVRHARAAEGVVGRLHVERFQAPAAPSTPSEGATGRIRFGGSAVTVDNDGRTLLEQAEAAGLRPEHGCRMGICHTCTRRLESGRVRDVRTGETCAEPGADIQLCVNAPAGDVTIDL